MPRRRSALSSSEPLLGGEKEGQRTAAYEWRLQKVGWAVMAVVVALALLGVFGTGPLSWTRASAPDGSVEVEYQRFVRNGGDSTISIRVPASQVHNGEARLWLANEYLGNVEVNHIVPEPRSQVAQGEGVLMIFEVADAATGLEATISATGDAVGIQSVRLAVAGGAPVDFWQLYYP